MATPAVLAHINGGSGRGRRGGEELERLVETARGRAADAGEWHVVRMLQDALDYPQGTALAGRDIAASPEALALLAADHKGRLVIQAAELRRRAAGLDVLRTVVEDPNASERELQRALEGQH
ncbi:hypothetical protein ACIQVC_13605 [Streptomyces sp. NPDC101112]|uniref:hypothetical protein n=1 Tax=Streptomyces sp. NPDC101112 TaxID=3366105 RepID=UPI00381C6088